MKAATAATGHLRNRLFAERSNSRGALGDSGVNANYPVDISSFAPKAESLRPVPGLFFQQCETPNRIAEIQRWRLMVTAVNRKRFRIQGLGQIRLFLFPQNVRRMA